MRRCVVKKIHKGELSDTMWFNVNLVWQSGLEMLHQTTIQRLSLALVARSHDEIANQQQVSGQ